jgi:CheY-like chemotaxis protein
VNANNPVALVVDDNAINRNLVMHMMRRIGWDTVAVDSGERALEVLKEARFELVLLDLRMPTMSGEETCRRIREDLGLRQLRIVAYTAHGMPEERARMLASGFDDLLIKPISFDDVRCVCAKALPVTAPAA